MNYDANLLSSQSTFSTTYTAWLKTAVLADTDVKAWLGTKLSATDLALFNSGSWTVDLNQNSTSDAAYIKFSNGDTFSLNDLFGGAKEDFSWTQGKATQTRWFFDTATVPVTPDESVELLPLPPPTYIDEYNRGNFSGSDKSIDLDLIASKLEFEEGEQKWDVTKAGEAAYFADGDAVPAFSFTPWQYIGSNYSDRMIGDDGIQAFSGEGGNDFLYGNGGNDELRGEGGDDHLVGGDGTDWLVGGDGNDAAYGDADDDTIALGAGNDWAFGGAGKDVIYGGEGADTLFGDHSDVANPGGDADEIHGGDGDDGINGQVGNDTLYGDGGADTISGEVGDDVISGGTGDDIVDAGEGFDTIHGDEGADKLDGGSDDDVIYGDAGHDVLYGKNGNDTLDGGEDNDYIFGGEGEDHILGNTGADTLFGDGGNDVIDTNDGNDAAYGGEGNDFIHGNAGDDVWLDGQAGNDAIFGDEGNDCIVGGEGNDFIVGGVGADTLFGSAGNDTFKFYEGDSTLAARDALNDFVKGEDLIDLANHSNAGGRTFHQFIENDNNEDGTFASVDAARDWFLANSGDGPEINGSVFKTSDGVYGFGNGDGVITLGIQMTDAAHLSAGDFFFG